MRSIQSSNKKTCYCRPNDLKYDLKVKARFSGEYNMHTLIVCACYYLSLSASVSLLYELNPPPCHSKSIKMTNSKTGLDSHIK